LLLFASFLAASASAQTLPGGIGKMMMPDISKIGAGNAAGVLGYCAKNKLVGGDASSVANSLLKKPGVQGSKPYKAGLAGTLMSGGSSLPLANVGTEMKSKACGAVLKQAKHLL
jgi:hypothetical protein